MKGYIDLKDTAIKMLDKKSWERIEAEKMMGRELDEMSQDQIELAISTLTAFKKLMGIDALCE